jgi:O-antigen/teichoic acid export membrane protein
MSYRRRKTLGAPGGVLMRQGMFLVASVSAANLSNYIFHVVMTRMLGPADYGALGALLAVILVLSVPASAFQAVIARRAATTSDDVELRSLLHGSAQLTAAIGLALTATLVLTAPWMKHFFKVNSVIPMLFLAAFMLPATIGPVVRGSLQGTERLIWLGLSLLGGTLIKLALGTGLVSAGAGIEGAVAAVALAEGLGLAIAFWPLRRLRAGPRKRTALAPIIREASRASLALLAYWLLVSIDLILARHYLPREVSGRYAAASLLGRAVLFLPAGLTLVVYPRFAARPNSRQAHQLLVVSLTIVWLLGGIATFVVAAFPSLIGILFGRAYGGVGAVGPLLTLAMTCYGLVNVLLFYRLAAGRAPVKTLWMGALAEIAAVIVFHRSPNTIAAAVLCTGMAVALWLLIPALRPSRVAHLNGEELWRSSETGVDISVITPAFNGASSISDPMHRLVTTLRRAGLQYEIILVSDGSRDGTARVAAELGIEDLRVIHYPANQGKGFALRAGFARARGAYVAFVDSDGDLDPEALTRFVDLMRLHNVDLIVGSKRHPLSVVSYPWTRRLMSRVYHLLVRVLFGLKVSDTQTGIKLVRREVIANVFPRLVEKRFAFDLELLVAARRLGYTRILEAPVRLNYRFGSTVSRTAIKRILIDTAAIWYRRYVVHHYDVAPASQAIGEVIVPAEVR